MGEDLGARERTAAELFVEAYKRYIHRAGAAELLEWLQQETDFFRAPASTTHHLAYPGGLVQHSFNVFTELRDALADFGGEENMEDIAICGLLHDICKANYYAVNYKQDPEGGISHYSVKDKLPMGHGEKSVYLIQKFMRLKDGEALAIRWHMGAWDDAVRGGSRGLNEAMKVSPLVYELHAADMRATHILEVE